MLTRVLDPLAFGVVPESLLPVIGYVGVVALVGWFVISRIAVKLLQSAVCPTQVKATGSRPKMV